MNLEKIGFKSENREIELRFLLLSALQSIFFDHSSYSRSVLSDDTADLTSPHLPYNLTITKQLNNSLIIDFIRQNSHGNKELEDVAIERGWTFESFDMKAMAYRLTGR